MNADSSRVFICVDRRSSAANCFFLTFSEGGRRWPLGRGRRPDAIPPSRGTKDLSVFASASDCAARGSRQSPPHDAPPPRRKFHRGSATPPHAAAFYTPPGSAGGSLRLPPPPTLPPAQTAHRVRSECPHTMPTPL